MRITTPAYGKLPRRKTIAYGRSNRRVSDIFQYDIPSKTPDSGLGLSSQPGKITKPTTEEKGPFFVQGKKASDLEWRVYRTLLKLGWTDSEIDFLVGNRNLGQEIDFVLYAYGAIYLIPVHGEAFHSRGQSIQKTALAEANAVQRYPGATLIPLYTSDLLNDDMALAKLSRLVGRG
jgi:hypothetical protein